VYKVPDYSPMMSHYLEIKKTLPDTLVFYRLGDFYEMFFDDAKIASSVLELVLTGRNAGVKEKVPMCGVPFHAVNSYLTRLVNSGYKVAIVEQMEEATGKGIVNREVVRIVTPGTNLEDQEDSMIAAISNSVDYSYLAMYNINQGTIYLHRITNHNYNLIQLCEEYQIKEVIIDEQKAELKLDSVIVSRCALTDKEVDEKLISLVIDEPLYQTSIKLLIQYLEITQKQAINNIKEVTWLLNDEYLFLDYHSKLNLELINNRHNTNKISLFQYINHCHTALGNRTLRSWIENPLRNLEKIKYRLDIIKYLNKEFLIKNEIKENLKGIYDIERILAKISYKRVNNKDLLALKTSVKQAVAIDTLLDEIWQEIKIKDNCCEIYKLLEKALNDNPESFNKEGQIFKDGYNADLDHYRNIQTNGEKWIYEMESELKERTQIKNLRISYNKVFGYYIEISKGNLGLIKDEFGFIRKQTLVNGERFITEELKAKEEEIVRSYDQVRRIEKALFEQLSDKLGEKISELQKLATMIGWIDSICSLAEVSKQYGYVEPTFNDKGILSIEEGKHPILATTLAKDYVANSCYLDNKLTTLLITGPNMGGKSTYIRQVALSVIMAQMGCYVCAKKAELPMFDQIFTRIGASDDITSGQSTFMVEMNEANQALQKATKDSLVLFDELGRGTSTYDGMSLAQAMIEYLTTCIKAKVLFSTHYHELVQLEDSLKGLKNVNVKVKESKDQIVFLYKVEDGKANKSYGINVAKLAHLPQTVIDRANQLLKEYEESHRFRQNEMIVEMVRESPNYEKIKNVLSEIDINGITPVKALNILAELKEISEDEDE